MENNYKIIGINYANEIFRKAQRLNTETMYKNGKVECVIEYSPEKLDEDFLSGHEEIFKATRGGGYWIWKPYIIKKTLSQLKDGDYLFYCDSGAVILKPIVLLIEALEASGQSVMCFSLRAPERMYTKRDAFILTGCDGEKYIESMQRLSGYLIIKNSYENRLIVDEWCAYAEDERILTDKPNTLGKPNYDGFIENRHDQTIWSLVTKKHDIKAFRDPSQFGRKKEWFSDEVNLISNYPVIIDSTRNGKIETWAEYKRFRFKMNYSPYRRFLRTAPGRKLKRKLRALKHTVIKEISIRGAK